MSIFGKALSVASTAKTFALNFWPWLLGAFLLGAATSPYPTFLVTRAVYQRATLKAERELSDWKADQVQGRIDAKAREERIMREAKETYDAQKSSIDAVATELRRLTSSVRVCTQVSTMQLRVPAATAGPPEAPAGGQPRPADVVLQELAAEFARKSDEHAVAYNSLMERWEKLAAEKQQ